MFDFIFKRKKEISVEDLKKKMSKNSINLIDVREISEYEEEHINEAVLHPLGTITEFNEKIDGKIYVICRSGKRSATACEILRKKGYDAINVKGGMLEWMKD